MNKNRLLALVLALVMLAAVLAGCQSDEARNLDSQIAKLSRKGVTLNSSETVYSIDRAIGNLSKWEQRSLQNLDQFKELYDQYIDLEIQAVMDLEAAIAALPAPDQIKLADEDAIEDAAYAYRKAPDAVQEKITNYNALQKVQQAMEDYKEKCFVKCEQCGGDGKVTCKLCNGRGSRQVNYTTPNGKTWRVSQECKTTSSCSACKGNGGTYEEK